MSRTVRLLCSLGSMSLKSKGGWIQNNYIGCYKEMQERINKLENELKEEQYKHDLTKKDLEYEKKISFDQQKSLLKNLEYEKKISFEQQQSLLKDIEILNLKLKMAQSNIIS